MSDLKILETQWQFIPTDQKSAIPVSISIFQPIMKSEMIWECHMVIQKQGQSIRRYGMGVDALDALICCLRVLACEAKAYSRNEKGEFQSFESTPSILKYISDV